MVRRDMRDGRLFLENSVVKFGLLPHDREWRPDPVAAGTPGAGWGSPPRAGRNAHSTPANTRSPETHWRLQESRLWPDAGASPNDLAQLKSCVQCALSLGESRPGWTRFPVRVRLGRAASAGLLRAAFLCFLHRAGAR